MKASEIREMSTEEIQHHMEDLKQKIFDLSVFQQFIQF